jgi:hypothetical protein
MSANLKRVVVPSSIRVLFWPSRHAEGTTLTHIITTMYSQRQVLGCIKRAQHLVQTLDGMLHH